MVEKLPKSLAEAEVGTHLNKSNLTLHKTGKITVETV